MRVILVLRSGGGFSHAHVQALQRQLTRWLPETPVTCLTDVGPIDGVHTERLTYLWPGWWSKLSMFAPHITGDVLYFDLDTVITGPLNYIAGVDRLTLLRDFYRPGHLGSGVMFIPEADRAEIWDSWLHDPASVMRNQRRGDQGFLERFWLQKAARWQDLLPGQIVSYKADVRSNSEVVPGGARVVAFHGKPRPWDLPRDHELYKAAGY